MYSKKEKVVKLLRIKDVFCINMYSETHCSCQM